MFTFLVVRIISIIIFSTIFNVKKCAHFFCSFRCATCVEIWMFCGKSFLKAWNSRRTYIQYIIYWNHGGQNFVDLSWIIILLRFINYTYSFKFNKLKVPCYCPLLCSLFQAQMSFRWWSRLNVRLASVITRNISAVNIYFWEIKKKLTSNISVCSFCEQSRPF